MTRWRAFLAAAGLASFATIGYFALNDDPAGGSGLTRARDGRGRIGREGGEPGGGGAAAAPETPPLMSFASAAGTGLSAECACTNVTTVQGTAVTVAAASRRTCTLRDYSGVSCEPNLPRIMSGRGTSGNLGILRERLSQSDFTSSDGRNFPVAAWVKTNMTAARNATGWIGDANGASRLTATAADATAAYTVTKAAAKGTLSCYMKRVTGTGAVTISRNGSVFSSDFSAQLSTTVWKRVVAGETPGCMGGGCVVVSLLTSSIANPVPTIKLATSGDVIIVDFCQEEPRDAPTSAINVEWSNVRAAEQVSTAVTMPVSTSYCRASTIVAPAVWRLAPATGAASYGRPNGTLSFDVNNVLEGYVDTTYWSYDYTGGSAKAALDGFNSGVGVPQGAVSRVATKYDGATLSGCVDGTCGTFATVFTPPSGVSTYYFGYSATGSESDGVESDVELADATTGCDLTLDSPDTATTLGPKYAALGDSLTKAPEAATSQHSWPRSLMALWGNPTSKYVSNFAISSVGTAHVRDSQWTPRVRNKGFTGIIGSAGVNDITTGVDSAATIFGRLETVYNQACSDGLKVYPSTLQCASGFAGWTGTMQTKLEAVNTSIRNWVAANPSCATLVEIYNDATMCTGTALAAGVNSGDGLHQNQAGDDRRAVLVNAVVP